MPLLCAIPHFAWATRGRRRFDARTLVASVLSPMLASGNELRNCSELRRTTRIRAVTDVHTPVARSWADQVASSIMKQVHPPSALDPNSNNNDDDGGANGGDAKAGVPEPCGPLTRPTTTSPAWCTPSRLSSAIWRCGSSTGRPETRVLLPCSAPGAVKMKNACRRLGCTP